MTENTIGSILRRDIPLLSPDTPIRRAVAVLVDTKSAAAPVLGDDGRLVGILTGKDCFRSALHASYYRVWTGVVGDHMSPEVVTVDADEEVIRVAELFLEHSHRIFPAMKDGIVTGLVYRSDVLALLSRFG